MLSGDAFALHNPLICINSTHSKVNVRLREYSQRATVCAYRRAPYLLALCVSSLTSFLLLGRLRGLQLRLLREEGGAAAVGAPVDHEGLTDEDQHHADLRQKAR